MSEEKKIQNEENMNSEKAGEAETAAPASASTDTQNYAGTESAAAQPEMKSEPQSEAEDLTDAIAPEETADEPNEDNSSKKGLFHSRRREAEAFSREKWILTHLSSDNLLEYLELEHKREELLQKTKEAKQKRLLSAFQLFISLAAVVAIIWLLRDNPSVMVNILYIIGIIGALWIWKNPKSK